jgi:SatD family (SatD)
LAKRFHILMADVVGSSKRNPDILRREFRSLINALNTQKFDNILSPFAITLGDEFQGIARSLKGAIDCIFFLEEEIIKRRYTFKLHYVLHWGEVRTPINTQIAYEMLGPGLTEARSILTNKQRQRPRFIFRYAEIQGSDIFNDLFFVIQRIIDRWKPADFALIRDMIAINNDAKIGRKRKKDRTLIWRRRQTLRTEEYLKLKQAVTLFADLVESVKPILGTGKSAHV